jgi:hypothetical protein
MVEARNCVSALVLEPLEALRAEYRRRSGVGVDPGLVPG